MFFQPSARGFGSCFCSQKILVFEARPLEFAIKALPTNGFHEVPGGSLAGAFGAFFEMKYRKQMERRLNALRVETGICAGQFSMDPQDWRDLVEENRRLRKRIVWWVQVGSRREKPWSKLRNRG